MGFPLSSSSDSSSCSKVPVLEIGGMVSEALRWRLLSCLTLPRFVSVLTAQQGRLYSLFVTVVARSLAVSLAIATLCIALALLKRSL